MECRNIVPFLSVGVWVKQELNPSMDQMMKRNSCESGEVASIFQGYLKGPGNQTQCVFIIKYLKYYMKSSRYWRTKIVKLNAATYFFIIMSNSLEQSNEPSNFSLEPNRDLYVFILTVKWGMHNVKNFKKWAFLFAFCYKSILT